MWDVAVLNGNIRCHVFLIMCFLIFFDIINCLNIFCLPFSEQKYERYCKF